MVAPPAGATLPNTAVPADAATVTVAGTTYYYYGNVFYKAVPQGGTMGFVTVEKPAGVTTVAALPADVKPQEAGNLTYLVAGGKYYMPYLDPEGGESYIAVDKPKATAAAGAAPGTQVKAIPLSVPAGTTLTVRLGSDISSTGKVGDRFQGNLVGDLLAGGQLVATNGTPVYGRVAQANAGTGTGGAPSLAIELTDIEVAGASSGLKTTQATAKGEGRSPARRSSAAPRWGPASGPPSTVARARPGAPASARSWASPRPRSRRATR